MIIRHGWRGWYALGAMMDAYDREEAYQYFLTTCVSGLGKLFSSFVGVEWPMPSFWEMLHPAEKKEEKGAKEIVQDLIAKLS